MLRLSIGKGGITEMKKEVDRQIAIAIICIIVYALCLIFLGDSDAQLLL